MPLIFTPKCKKIIFLPLVLFGARLFAQPVISSFTPATAAQGAYVRIAGKNFTGTTAVSFGGVAASSFSLEEDTAIVAVVGNGATGNIVVSTPAGADSISGFTWKAQSQPPSIYYFAPSSGSSGDTVLITGANLTTVNGVAFGGYEAAGYGVKNDSVIWAVLAMGATGFVTVTNPDGTSVSGSGFTFISTSGPLHLTRFYPDSAAAGGTVYISGLHLDSLTSVSFGGVRARSYRTQGDTLLIAMVDTGRSGKIMVSGEFGIDSVSGFHFIGGSSQDTTPITPPPPVVDTFQLQQFVGLDSTQGVVLFWNAFYDQKMQSYFVFGGQDSTNLTELGTVASLHQDIAAYSYNATLGVSGPWYFQLHMEDSSGAVTNSQLISVTHRGSTQVVKSYPNPVTNVLTVAVPSTNANASLVITDPAGRVVQTVVVAPNTVQVTIDVASLNNGIYRVLWSDGQHRSVSTVLVVK